MKKILMSATLLVLLVVFLAPVIMLEFGNPAYTDMDQYMIQMGQVQTGVNNIVTAVVFDFRGFDTLGEATVLFTAVLGVGLLFRKLSKEDEYEYE